MYIFNIKLGKIKQDEIYTGRRHAYVITKDNCFADAEYLAKSKIVKENEYIEEITLEKDEITVQDHD